jgi:hypothetical protein
MDRQAMMVPTCWKKPVRRCWVAAVESRSDGASKSGDEAPELMTARKALEVATLGGAAVLAGPI